MVKIKKYRKPRVRDFFSKAYIQWRTSVYKRDKYCCQWPGCKIKRKKINAHHIRRWANYPTLRFLVANGITLCEKHHKMIQGKEDDYVLMFLRILASKLRTENV